MTPKRTGLVDPHLDRVRLRVEQLGEKVTARTADEGEVFKERFHHHGAQDALDPLMRRLEENLVAAVASQQALVAVFRAFERRDLANAAAQLKVPSRDLLRLYAELLEATHATPLEAREDRPT